MATTVTGTIEKLSRLTVSAMGNPRFSVTIKLDGQEHSEGSGRIVAQTQSDSSFAYAIENTEFSGAPHRGIPAPRLRFHLTRAGRIAYAEVIAE